MKLLFEISTSKHSSLSSLLSLASTEVNSWLEPSNLHVAIVQPVESSLLLVQHCHPFTERKGLVTQWIHFPVPKECAINNY